MNKNFDFSTLKENAKATMKTAYWRLVGVGLILAVCTASSGGSGGRGATNSINKEGGAEAFQNMDPTVLMAIIIAVVGAVVVAIIVGALFSIFLLHPLEVGCRKFTLDVREDSNAYIGTVGMAFSSNYKNIVKVMFLRGLYTFLWSLLFVIPGIVKSYQYRMIPYLLAENPDITAEEAFAKSKEMMDGVKWRTFVLDLSFFGWFLLVGCTCGILGIFYVNPYFNQTCAELYVWLKNAVDPGAQFAGQDTADQFISSYYN